MAKRLRVGFIGMGGIIQNHHLPDIREIPGVEAAALAEIDQQTADARGDLVNIPLRYGDHRRMLREVELDAVVIGTPNHLHCPQTLDALKAGCHVLVEKPMGVNLGEIKRMIATSKRVRKTVMAGLCYRYRPQIQTARELAQSGALGKIYHLRVKYLRRRGIPGMGDWWTSKACGGGALADIGVHVVDAAMYIAGLPMPTYASAMTYRKFGHRKDYTYIVMWGSRVGDGPMDVEDYATGFIRFGNKMTMSIEISWAAELQEGSSMEVLGDRGGLFIKDDDKASRGFILYTQRGDKLVEESISFRRTDRFAVQARHFVDCIRKGRKPLSDLTTALPVHAVLDGMYRSAEAGREVRI